MYSFSSGGSFLYRAEQFYYKESGWMQERNQSINQHRDTAGRYYCPHQSTVDTLVLGVVYEPPYPLPPLL